MGFEDEVEQSFSRPCRQTSDRSKRTYDLTSSIVPRGTSFHRSVEIEFPSIEFDPGVQRNSVPSIQMPNLERRAYGECRPDPDPAAQIPILPSGPE
jgi:hypothetical protein